MANTVASKETATENPKLTGLHSPRSLQPKQKHNTPWNKRWRGAKFRHY